MRLVEETKPKVFIFENVKGLLSHDDGNTWKVLKEEFEKLKYNISHKVLNARDFGIPQNRERVFVVGFRKKTKFIFPKSIDLNIKLQDLNIKLQDLLEDAPDPKYFLPEKGIKFVEKESNLKKRYTQIDGEIALCQKANQQFNWHGDFITQEITEDYMQKYFLSQKVEKYVLSTGTKNFYSRPETDLEIARPLLSTMAKMHRAGVDNYITRNGKLRKLTPRECMRLMGFSDKFNIVVSDTQAYKQAGNSIVVDVLVNLLSEILKTNIFNDEGGKSVRSIRGVEECRS